MTKLKEQLLSFLLLILALSATAQCPEKTTIVKSLYTLSANTDHARAISGLRNLAAQCRQCKFDDDSTYAKILDALGRNLLVTGKLDSVIIFSKQAIEINSRHSAKAAPANLCHSYYLLGRTYVVMGNFKLAEQFLEKAALTGSRYPEKSALVASAYIKKADLYTSLGDLGKTVQAANKAYQYADLVPDYALMAESLLGKAQALITLGKYRDAEVPLKRILKLTKDDFGILGSAHSLLAEVCKKQSRPQEVITLYTKSIDLFTKDSDPYGSAEAANNLGEFYEDDLKDLTNALKYYEIARTFIPQEPGRAAILTNISDLLKKTGDYENALRYNQLALAAILGYFKNEDPQKNPLSVNLRNTVNKNTILALIRNKADTWFEYARRSANDRRKLQNALNSYMLADTLIDYMRWEHIGAVPKMYWRKKTRSMYEHAIETCYLLRDAPHAFHFFEKSRAVLLNDQLSELGASQLLSAEDLKTQNELAKKISAWQVELAGKESDRKQATELQEKLFAANQKRERFFRRLERKYPQYYAYRLDNRVTDVAAMQKNVLGSNQHFVSYFEGDSALYGMAISSDDIILKKLDLGKFISLTVGFQRLIGDREDQNRRFSDYLSIAYDMYATLFKPFDIPLNTRVVISADGSFFPFQALSFSKEKPDYLVKNYAFSYAYSGSSLAKKRRSGNLNLFAKSFLGLAPVQFDPTLRQPKLPNSDLVLKTIGDKFFYAKTLTGPEASRRAFIKESPHYRIVQLLTHANADGEGISPTLYFADSTLRLNELAPASRSATELLVLSACQTGVGRSQRGSGVFGLARGFAALGVPSTLTTLWKVENESSQKLTELVYAEIEKGLPLDVALQRAQAVWLKNASAGEGLPYSWAGLVLVGTSAAVETGVSRSVGFVFLGAVLVLGVFLYYYLKKKKNKRVHG